MESIGQRIRQARERAGMTVKELAEFVYYSDTTVSGWEKGKTTPRPETMKKIADVLGVSTWWLLGLSGGEDDDKAARMAVHQSEIQDGGTVLNKVKAIEEMGELIQELCKDLAGQGDTEKLAEELADAAIMLERLVLLYDMEDKVREYMAGKIRRQQERIAERRGEA